MLVERYKRNLLGRDFVMGDLHGMIAALESKLEAISFDTERDRLFAVGDLIDRGPDSVTVIDLLSEKWFHSVRGNHEQMLIDYYLHKTTDAKAFIANGGGWYFDLNECGKAEFYDACSKLPYVIEIETDSGRVGVLHAECPVNDWSELIALVEAGNDDVITQMLWSQRRVKSRDASVVTGIDMIMVGHTTLESAGSLGNHLYIDTGAYLADGYLTLAQISRKHGAC